MSPDNVSPYDLSPWWLVAQLIVADYLSPDE